MSIEMKKNEKFEVRIDPRTFEGEWLQHKPVSHAEQEAMKTYKKQKCKGELPVFTCMSIDPAFVNNELVYEKGLIPAVGYSYPFWRRVIREYDPTRNSRMMSLTEYQYRNMFIVQRLFQAGWSVEDSWKAVFRDSKNIGNFRHSIEGKSRMNPTGSNPVAGFYDLGNTRKLLSRDFYQKKPRKEKIYIGGGSFNNLSGLHPVGFIQEFDWIDTKVFYAIGMLVMDP